MSRQVSYDGHSGAVETLGLCEWTEDCPLGPGRVSFAGRRLKVPWYSPPGRYASVTDARETGEAARQRRM